MRATVNASRRTKDRLRNHPNAVPVHFDGDGDRQVLCRDGAWAAWLPFDELEDLKPELEWGTSEHLIDLPADITDIHARNHRDTVAPT